MSQDDAKGFHSLITVGIRAGAFYKCAYDIKGSNRRPAIRVSFPRKIQQQN